MEFLEMRAFFDIFFIYEQKISNLLSIYLKKSRFMHFFW